MRRQNSFRDVLAVGEFRALWSAEIISVCGDQLARVALSVLVFQRTSSAALTALTYALTFVPALLGGVLLAGLADRFPRRTVLVLSDLVRAGFAGLMALPDLPIPALWVLVFGLAMAGGPFKAAQQALLPEVLRGDRYRVGLALRTVSTQTAQLAGFAVGGSVLLLVPVQTALGINASTFVLSAVIARMGVRARPAPAGAPRTVDHPRHRSAIMVLAGNRRLLVLAGLTWLAGLTVAPEGVAAPYAAGFGGSAVAVGLLLAADPLGGALGGWLFGRWQSRVARTKAMVPLAVLSGLALVPCALRPGLLPSVALWASSGAFSTLVLLHSHALLMRWVPNARRAAVAGLVSAGLQTSQGLAVLAAGLLGQQVGVYRAVAVIGAITVAIAVMLGLMWQRRAQPRVARTIRDGHGFGHGMRLRRSDVTVAHSGASLPGSSDSDKAGGA